MPSSGLRKNAVTKAGLAQAEIVAGVLEGYAARGVFRGFARGRVDHRGTTFRIAWHWNRVLDLVFDFEGRALRCGKVLTNVPADSVLIHLLDLASCARVSV